jgi:hypothetical protein
MAGKQDHACRYWVRNLETDQEALMRNEQAIQEAAARWGGAPGGALRSAGPVCCSRGL